MQIQCPPLCVSQVQSKMHIYFALTCSCPDMHVCSPLEINTNLSLSNSASYTYYLCNSPCLCCFTCQLKKFELPYHFMICDINSKTADIMPKLTRKWCKRGTLFFLKFKFTIDILLIEIYLLPLFEHIRDSKQ